MTWSILVRDSATGALGAAVASRFFAVGALCIHVEGRVAALATQALVNPMYAVRAMPRLRQGETPDAILAELVGEDPGRAERQFHILDASGRIAQHTGEGCVSWAGHMRGILWVSRSALFICGRFRGRCYCSCGRFSLRGPNHNPLFMKKSNNDFSCMQR